MVHNVSAVVEVFVVQSNGTQYRILGHVHNPSYQQVRFSVIISGHVFTIHCVQYDCTVVDRN